MAYDYQQRTSECEYFSPPDDEQIHRARLVVCSWSRDATEAEELMSALGIHPRQEGVFDPVIALPTLPTQMR
jgi:hypothetical protein